MPRILQINSVCNIGSTGRIAEGIGLAILDEGWESYIGFGRFQNQSRSNTFKIGSKWSFLWHVFEARLFDNQGRASRRATSRCIEQIKQIRPDIIHLHNIHGYYLNYKRLFAFLASQSIPVVWTLHDCWSMTGHCCHFFSQNCEKWKTQCKQCTNTGVYPTSIWRDRSKKNYIEKQKIFTSIPNLTLVVVSEWLKGIVELSYLKNQALHRIYNGIDLEVFKQKTGPHPKEKIRILGVSFIWTNRKGLSDFKMLRSMLDQERYEITLVGLTQKQMQELPRGIRGIMRTANGQELARLYQESDIYVNPTWEDSFPTTNLEALACGTPVITYKTGGSVEAVTPETGIIVVPGDSVGLIRAIEDLSSRDREMLSQACRQRATTYFNKLERYKDYVELYKTLLPKSTT